MLDTIKTIETPEGVELKLTCVSFFARGCAWFLDTAFQVIIVVIIIIILVLNFNNVGKGLFLIILFALNWFYPIFFELYNQGQTPGQAVMNIQVLSIDGTLVNWKASFIRNLLRTVDFLPFFYILGIISILLNKNFQRLGDIVANTIVVYKWELDDHIDIKKVDSIAPAMTLNAIEQQMILNYAERFNDFSAERAEELALLAKPLITPSVQKAFERQSSNEKYPASKHLLAIANYLMGHK